MNSFLCEDWYFFLSLCLCLSLFLSPPLHAWLLLCHSLLADVSLSQRGIPWKSKLHTQSFFVTNPILILCIMFSTFLHFFLISVLFFFFLLSLSDQNMNSIARRRLVYLYNSLTSDTRWSTNIFQWINEQQVCGLQALLWYKYICLYDLYSFTKYQWHFLTIMPRCLIENL